MTYDNTNEPVGGPYEELLCDEKQLECQMCGEVETILLGTLGDTTHYRCRACGADSYSMPPTLPACDHAEDEDDRLQRMHDSVGGRLMTDEEQDAWEQAEDLDKHCPTCTCDKHERECRICGLPLSQCWERMS